MDALNRLVRPTLIITLLILLAVVVFSASAQESTSVAADPLVRMPGAQPGDGVSLESPNRCLNCHSGYNQAVEPGFNWMGSMMAQSARDFMFWSAMTVAAQDAMWATGPFLGGTPSANATDICERCHFPKGWLEGRSDPTNASLMSGADYDGVQCDFCHRMVDPFFEQTYTTWMNDPATWEAYWDETNTSSTPSGPASTSTYQEDALLAEALTLFNGAPAYIDHIYFSSNYTEAASGQYFVSSNADKRASFADAEARHQMFYSRFHKSQAFCGTCHDVSNPVLQNLGADPTQPLPTELQSASSYFHVERTFSEFMLSAYAQPGGAPGVGPFAPGIYTTSDPDNNIRMCQDCHMRDVVGAGADKHGVPVRPGDSVEHPESGQPLHDMTGGNMWVSRVLASATPGSPNYDATNDQLLNRPAALTLDLTQGQGIDPAALLAGADRAAQQLQLAASIENLSYDPISGDLSFRVQNQTGHKLISGFPEGRRMFVNVKVYSGGQLIYEVNPYDATAGTLKGLSASYSTYTLPAPETLASNEVYEDTLVYEMHPSSSLTGETETLHFVLADGRYKDNRIPPQGFRIADAGDRLVVPVYAGAEDEDYFTSEEYSGGYDEVDLSGLVGGDYVEVNLYYQTTSREYIEFLRNEINGATEGLGGYYVIGNDPFFDGLRAWGDTIWQLWTHNMNQPGAAPFLMTSATFQGSGTGCTPPAAPQLTAAQPGHNEVTVSWTDVAGEAGYNVYYDQAGKAQLVTSTGPDQTTYIDTGLSDLQEYCYKVTSYATTDTETCESAYSNILCATPTSPGHASIITAASVVTGQYTGRGNNKTFTPSTSFQAGDEIVVQVAVVDDTGAAVGGALAEVTISGPDGSTTLNSTTDSNGLAEMTWATTAPKGNKPGTASGNYTATVTNLSASGYAWDQSQTSTSFTIQ